MPLHAYHPAVKKRLPEWQKILHCVGGEDVIKTQRDVYLPRLNYTRADRDAQRKYDDYLLRAEFPDITGRTVKGILGMLFRRPPTVTVPKSSKSILDNVTGTGTKFIHFSRQVTEQLIAPSRVGILVDASGVGQAYQTWYWAMNIVKWWERPHPITKLPEIWRLVLRECTWIADPDDPDDIVEAIRWRELRLVDGAPPMVRLNGEPMQPEAPEDNRPVFLIHQLWREDLKDKKKLVADGGPIVIVRQGAAVSFIPFVFGNPGSLSPFPEPPVLLGIANTNLGIYRNSADLENGRHWTGRPQPYWFGVKRKSARGVAPEIEFGSTRVWTSEDPNAHAGFVSIGGEGLKSLETGIETKKSLAIEQGARLVESRPAQLTATQSKIRDESEKSTVMTLADTSSDLLSTALAIQVWWDTPGMKLEEAKKQVQVTLNPDRGVTLSPEAAKAWAEIQLFGTVMSLRETFDLFKRHGVYEDSVTYKDHLAMVKADREAGLAVAFQDNGANDPPPHPARSDEREGEEEGKGTAA